MRKRVSNSKAERDANRCQESRNCGEVDFEAEAGRGELRSRMRSSYDASMTPRNALAAQEKKRNGATCAKCGACL
jgi:hypothetical protein